MKSLGIIVAAIAFLISGYELLALTTSLPTISRVVQGWRDDGFGTLVTAGLAVVVAVIVGFAVWLWKHIRYEKRSKE